MTDTDTAITQPVKTGRGGRLVIGILATIVLGAVGSGLWDILFKPGIGRIGRLITGLSRNTDNTVFTTAALDPMPLSSLIIVLLLAMIPMLGAILFIHLGFVRRTFETYLDRMFRRQKIESKESHRRRLRRTRRIVASIGAVMCLLFYFAAQTGFAVLNEAVLVWRTFHKNLDICAPYAPAEKTLEMCASFRLMKTRDDFAAVRQSLDALASQHGVKLEWYDTRK